MGPELVHLGNAVKRMGDFYEKLLFYRPSGSIDGSSACAMRRRGAASNARKLLEYACQQAEKGKIQVYNLASRCDKT